MNDKWVRRWEVEGNSGHTWVVAVDRDGNYGCSCPVWKFQRKECHHIAQIKNRSEDDEYESIVKPRYVIARVLKPEYNKEHNELRVPLVGLPDTYNMEQTICYYMLKHGFSMSEIKEIRHLTKDWTKEAIESYIARHGETEYPEDWYNAPFNRVMI